MQPGQDGYEIKEYLMGAVCNYSTFSGETVYHSGVVEDERGKQGEEVKSLVRLLLMSVNCQCRRGLPL